MRPIFIGRTRSFWLGILPALLIVLDVVTWLAAAVFSDPQLVPPVATLAGWMLGLDVVVIEEWMLRMSPLFALIIAQQRAGSARPYTLDPRAK
ncbi:hypothetical protein [Falsigemmobacter faecalis]|uniref:Uncharacterized protein n=1 Tax=Falsigemmobacter faecalis TaxID=2488730 RepID=A0A3P3D6N7_9RHOB|nr:hypothetical protein [Falsigemmobacter faecalis]RRH70040.1 hypothetical protein EG244_17680 [Falsigemmobacter faecalis]